MKSKLVSLIIASVVLFFVFTIQGKDEFIVKGLELSIPLVFIWFNGFIIEYFGDSILGFFMFGRASGLSDRHLKYFGWFLLIVLPLSWIFLNKYL